MPSPALPARMKRLVLLVLLAAAGSTATAADPAPVLTAAAANAPGSPGTAAARGAQTYGHYCAVCHGANADGNGRAATLLNPRPANLRTSDKDDAYLGLIVRRGGAALGRSASMPPWSEELSNEQVDDIVAFIRSVNTRP